MRLFCYFLLVMLNISLILSKNVSTDTGYLQNCNLELLDLTISSTSTDSLRLWLYTNNPGVHHSYNVTKAASLIKDSTFRKDFRTVLLCLGIYDGPDSDSVKRVISAYMDKGFHNVILLDSTSVLRLPYIRSARLVRYVGIRLGRVLFQLSKSGLQIQSFDLVGHSLGAHVAGIAGRTFKSLSGRKLPRIVALDPAGPCFRKDGETQRINETDAAFVQVLHTNGGSAGLMSAVGNVDFYINGGRSQRSEYGKTCSDTCSHSKALDYWTSAVYFHNKFVAIKCKAFSDVGNYQRCVQRGAKKGIMGPAADSRLKGLFYLPTYYYYPYFVREEDLYPVEPYWHTYVFRFY